MRLQNYKKIMDQQVSHSLDDFYLAIDSQIIIREPNCSDLEGYRFTDYFLEPIAQSMEKLTV